MKHDIGNLKEKWDRFRIWCIVNESLTIVIGMWMAAIVITSAMVYCG